MKKTDLYLKPGTYIRASTTQGEVQGTSLENFVVSVLNNPTCCPKPSFIKDGMLMTAAYLDTSLQTVTDQGPNSSPLKLSTLLVRVESALEIAERLRLEADSTVTTQISSVIQATTTNANLVIAPNGTGALIADIPDGTTAGGNARGANSVDLQMVRSDEADVAGGDYSVVLGGQRNRTSIGPYNAVVGGYFNQIVGSSQSGVIAGGNSNTINASNTTISGGRSNVVSSQYSTISGGQSNTASTSTHATVVGGQSNTSSGQHSVSGGNSSVASGNSSIALGLLSNASNTEAIGIGRGTASGQNSLALQQATASGQYSFATTLGNASGSYSVALGRFTIANSLGSCALPYSEARAIASLAACEGIAYGLNSIVAGQYSQSQTTAPFSSVFGSRSNAYLQGQNTNAGGYFAAIGDAQQSLLTARREASLNSAATTVLSLDGTGTTNLIIPDGNNRLWAVKVVATAFVSVAGGTLVLGDSYMGEFTLLFKRVGGTSSVVGVNSANLIYDTNMATAAFTFAAGASQDLQITFKAPTTASATTFRCVAKVELVEVAY